MGGQSLILFKIACTVTDFGWVGMRQQNFLLVERILPISSFNRGWTVLITRYSNF